MILMVILFLLLLSGLTVRLAGYRMAYFIAADDDRSGTELERGFESVSESVRLMKGNRCTYCLLHLSFLPWFALLLPAGLTGGAIYMLSSVSSGAAVFLLSTLAIVFGVIFLTGSIFLMLYRRTVSAAFYSVITGNFHFAE